MKKNKVWTSQDLADIKAGCYTYKEISVIFGVSYHAGVQVCKRLGVKLGRFDKVTEEEILRVKQLYPTHTVKEISQIMGIKICRVGNILKRVEYRKKRAK
ncbi:MAG: hypothetical protein ACRCXX_11700 [Cetobacterium sp.]|uniref:hypothetical protein n=1 Tax=Cetobacterium sp. TaxID=2071632 RepID=UPI003F2D8850